MANTLLYNHHRHSGANSLLAYCLSRTDETHIFMPAAQVHFVTVVLLSFDDEWMMGGELGLELWITELVFSEQALIHDQCSRSQSSTIHVGLVCVWREGLLMGSILSQRPPVSPCSLFYVHSATFLEIIVHLFLGQ